MKKHILLLVFLFSLWGLGSYAQNTDISPKGIFVPHLSTTQRSAISSPTNGQMIYNLDINCFEVYQNFIWQKLCGLEGTTQEKWTEKATLSNLTRSYAVSFVIGDKAYAGTGEDNSVYFKDFWEYNPKTNTWTQKADFGGTARGEAISFSVGNKGYLGTGYNTSGYLKDFWQYDPANNTWTQKADFSGPERAEAYGLSAGDKGYVGNGVNSISYFKDFWEYNSVTDTWTQKADFGGSARFGSFSFAIGNEIFVGAGLDDVINDYTSDFYGYDISSNQWTSLSEFGGGKRYAPFAFAIGSKGYVGSGQGVAISGSNVYTDFWEYDPIGDVWLQKEDLGTVGAGGVTCINFSINGKGYAGTGYYNFLNTLNDLWEFNPSATTLTTEGNSTNSANQLLKLDGNGNINISGKRRLDEIRTTPLSNDWVDYGDTFAGATFYKDDDDIVYFGGLIKGGITATNTNLFILPYVYRPTERLIFIVHNSGGYGRVDVLPTGEVQIINGGNTFLSLSNIHFRANGAAF